MIFFFKERQPVPISEIFGWFSASLDPNRILFKKWSCYMTTHRVSPVLGANALMYFHRVLGASAFMLFHRVLGANKSIIIIIIIIINPLTARVDGAPQMILQPVFSIFPCSPLPSGTCRTPGMSIPWCCLPTSSFVRLVFFPLSLCLARWFWPDLMNGKHDHSTAVCVFLRSSGDLHVVQLPAGSWHGLPRW